MSFGDAEIPLTCPKCGRKIKKSLSWLESHEHVDCTCGLRMRFDEKSRREVRKLADSLRRIETKLKTLGEKMRKL